MHTPHAPRRHPGPDPLRRPHRFARSRSHPRDRPGKPRSHVCPRSHTSTTRPRRGHRVLRAEACRSPALRSARGRPPRRRGARCAGRFPGKCVGSSDQAEAVRHVRVGEVVVRCHDQAVDDSMQCEERRISKLPGERQRTDREHLMIARAVDVRQREDVFTVQLRASHESPPNPVMAAVIAHRARRASAGENAPLGENDRASLRDRAR